MYGIEALPFGVYSIAISRRWSAVDGQHSATAWYPTAYTVSDHTVHLAGSRADAGCTSSEIYCVEIEFAAEENCFTSTPLIWLHGWATMKEKGALIAHTLR